MKNLEHNNNPGTSPSNHQTSQPNQLLDEHGAVSDDALFPAEIAALYLRMPPSDFADLQKPKRTDGRTGAGGPGLAKFDKTSKAPSHPATFKRSTLREMGKFPISSAADEALAKAGLVGWATTKLPFFAELEPRVKRGRRVLIGNAWDLSSPHRESRFADLLTGRIRFTWVTSSEAAASLWSDEGSHRAFAARGLALLEAESRAIEASVVATQRLAADAAGPADPLER